VLAQVVTSAKIGVRLIAACILAQTQGEGAHWHMVIAQDKHQNGLSFLKPNSTLATTNIYLL
jgi:hypothetical protein